MRTLLSSLALSLSLFACASAPSDSVAPEQGQTAQATESAGEGQVDLAKAADELAHRVIILDGHVDTPWRLIGALDEQGKVTEDVSLATERGDFDYPRAKEGGLDAPFMSIYIPAYLEKEAGKSKAYADQLIGLVEDMVRKSPGKFAFGKSVADVRKNFEAGVISLPMGMENGSAIEGKLENIAYFHERGIRYITLTHSKDNHISDSSYDEKHTHKGLSAFGKTVVPEMNRVGIMVDVSHISDDAFWHVMELTKVPVIASHSSCRHFMPGYHRNMGDKMIEALAKNGGVIQINFGSNFLSKATQIADDEETTKVTAIAVERGIDPQGPGRLALLEEYRKDHPLPLAKLNDVADHIMHVVNLVGVEHVGLGSDFDGVGDTLPVGLKDVSDYPALFEELLRRGLSEADIEKIASGNVLRVWEAVEAYAASSTK